jgi:hypothetical protein
MQTNLGYIAVGLYILIMLGLMIMPRKWLKSTAKKDFGVMTLNGTGKILLVTIESFS